MVLTLEENMNQYLFLFAKLVVLSLAFFSASKVSSHNSEVSDLSESPQALCASTKHMKRVVLNGKNTGVKNSSDEYGCSVNDYFEYCNNGGMLNIDFHYRGESSCEQKMAYWLFRKGKISYIEWRWIREKL